MKRVDVDFNMLVRGGMVLADPDFATDDLRVDDWVEAVDFADPEMRYVGQVVALDDNGMAYLQIDWAQGGGAAGDPVQNIGSADAVIGIDVSAQNVGFTHNQVARPWGIDRAEFARAG